MPTRDPEKTRARILAAATHEFAAKGFDGARVDTIARRAKTNKRMLYHYFGDKKALFEATVGQLLADQQQMFAGAPSDLEDRIVFHFSATPQKSKWLRLLLWEALAYGEGPVMAEMLRREAMAKSCTTMREAQKQSDLLPNARAELVMLAMMAMSVFPWAFPQVTRMLTGTAPSDPGFQREYSDVLRQVVRRLKRENKSRVGKSLELS